MEVESLTTKTLPCFRSSFSGQAYRDARSCRFLASDDASFATGSVVTVNGGAYFS